jgi:hypothetical protein
VCSASSTSSTLLILGFNAAALLSLVEEVNIKNQILINDPDRIQILIKSK